MIQKPGGPGGPGGPPKIGPQQQSNNQQQHNNCKLKIERERERNNFVNEMYNADEGEEKIKDYKYVSAVRIFFSSKKLNCLCQNPIYFTLFSTNIVVLFNLIFFLQHNN